MPTKRDLPRPPHFLHKPPSPLGVSFSNPTVFFHVFPRHFCGEGIVKISGSVLGHKAFATEASTNPLVAAHNAKGTSLKKKKRVLLVGVLFFWLKNVGCSLWFWFIYNLLCFAPSTSKKHQQPSAAPRSSESDARHPQGKPETTPAYGRPRNEPRPGQRPNGRPRHKSTGSGAKTESQ